jgi:pyridoxamine 5'-phosphate oxidase
MSQHPISQFSQWLEDAKNTKAITEPTAMALATATAAGEPSVRMVLLKAHDERGFVFYTNLESRKSAELLANPKAALCFYWMPLERQVRVEGRIEPVSDAEADAYFATRARDSQVGAWSSKQSRPLKERVDLLQAISNNMARFDGREVSRPPFWSGFRVVPHSIEFWQQGDFRLHERTLHTLAGSQWQVGNLYP